MIKAAIAFPQRSERRSRERAESGFAPEIQDGIVVKVDPAGEIQAPLLAAWRELVAEASEPNSFSEPWFVTAGLRSLGREEEVRLVQIWSRRGGVPILLGLLPLCERRNYGRMRVHHVQNWGHFHNFLGTPLIRRGQEKNFWTALLRYLDAADWAPGFLHLHNLVAGGPVHLGLEAAARHLGRTSPVVHRSTRAMLASTLSPEAYYETNIRKKKRKELQRLSRRLAELGRVDSRAWDASEPVESWCDSFLDLERSGWKGRAGSALSDSKATESFFRDAVAGAAAAGRLQLLRLDLDGRPIAMLVNFLAPPGSFSFKIAYDENFGHFSPGVLIQLDNLQLLGRDDINWMDSCAAENHPMIESLWAERRTIVRLTVRLRGFRRAAVYYICRLLENAAALARRVACRARGNGR